MQRRVFSREFKLEAVKLVRDRNVAEPPRVWRRLFCLSHAAGAGCSNEA